MEPSSYQPTITPPVSQPMSSLPLSTLPIKKTLSNNEPPTNTLLNMDNHAASSTYNPPSTYNPHETSSITSNDGTFSMMKRDNSNSSFSPSDNAISDLSMNTISQKNPMVIDSPKQIIKESPFVMTDTLC